MCVCLLPSRVKLVLGRATVTCNCAPGDICCTCSSRSCSASYSRVQGWRWTCFKLNNSMLSNSLLPIPYDSVLSQRDTAENKVH